MRECPNSDCSSTNLSVEEDLAYAENLSVICPGCGMRGPEAPDREAAEKLWDALPRVTKLARRELLDKQLYEEYAKGDVSYKSLAEIHNMSQSRVFSGIQRHREFLKEGA
jgi:hypothetical protein